MSNAAQSEDIRTWFQGKVPANRTSLGYRLALGLAGLLMVLLPLIYLAIIGAVGYFIYWHAVNNLWMLTDTKSRGRSGRGALLGYAAPIAAGALLIVFLIKPLFARKPKRERPRTLKREDEPRLFAFVDAICDTVKSPRPREIAVDCLVNASAGLRRGWLSLFLGDLTLTIGLPLAAGLDARQFAGVLAHEFGHFSQGAGMRFSYIIRSINLWFVRVVYERDSWDTALEEWSRDGDFRVMIMVWMFRGCVWLSRRVLWCLMWVGHVVSCILLRQMEYDADRYEARLSGSETFASTSWKLHVLNMGAQGASVDLRELFGEGRLVDNYPRLVTVNVEQIPPPVLEEVRESVTKTKTGWFDTHPADTDRIASARRENAPGVFHGTGPATQLFSDFDALAKSASVDYYRGMLGPAFERVSLTTVDQVRDRQQNQTAAAESAKRFFLGQFSALRPLQWPAGFHWLADDLPACHARLQNARQQLSLLLPTYQQSLLEYREADDAWYEGHIAVAMHNAKIRIQANQFKQAVGTLNEALSTRGNAEQRQHHTAVNMPEFERLLVERMTSDLALLSDPLVVEKLPDAAALKEESTRLIEVLARVTQQLERLIELRNVSGGTQSLLSHIDSQRQNASYINELNARFAHLARLNQEVGAPLAALAYPFEHAQQGTTVAAQVFGDWPVGDDPGSTVDAAQSALDRLPTLQWRLITRLTEIAEKVEAALGYEPLMAETVTTPT